MKWTFSYPEESAPEGMKNAALKGVTAKASMFAGLEDVKEGDAAAQKELEEQKRKINFPFTIGDTVVISKEPQGPYGLFTGAVVDILLDARQIVVIPNVEARESLRGDLGVEMVGNQLNDLEELAGRPTGTVAVQQPNKRTVYRLDKDVFGGSFSKIRGDLMKLVSQQAMDNPAIEKVRDLLIFTDRVAPQFTNTILQDVPGSSFQKQTVAKATAHAV